MEYIRLYSDQTFAHRYKNKISCIYDPWSDKNKSPARDYWRRATTIFKCLPKDKIDYRFKPCKLYVEIPIDRIEKTLAEYKKK